MCDYKKKNECHVSRKSNRMIKNIFLFMVFVLTASNSTMATETNDRSEQEHTISSFTGLKRDIPIGEIDGTLLRINIALPEKPSVAKRPAIVMIHGGGLIKGNKDLLNRQIKAMAKRGLVAASVQYRLAPQHRFPAALEDVKTAIRFLKANAHILQLDVERIVVSGASAGGYLAVMVGVTGNADGFANHGLYADYDSKVSAVITHAAPVGDFTQRQYADFAVVKRFINQHEPDKHAALAAISPVTYLDKHDPAFFLDHGSADEKVPVSMAREFVSVLDANDHPHEYIEVEGGKHSLNASRPKQAKVVFKASMAFLDRYAFPEER